MKIAYTGFELPEGKVKYNDAILADLEKKFKPDKVSPYYIELLPEGFEAAEGIAIARDSVLDLLILDMDKIEGRLSVAEDETEKAVLAKCFAHLEGEQPVCNLELTESEREFVHGFGMHEPLKGQVGAKQSQYQLWRALRLRRSTRCYSTQALCQLYCGHPKTTINFSTR